MNLQEALACIQHIERGLTRMIRLEEEQNLGEHEAYTFSYEVLIERDQWDRRQMPLVAKDIAEAFALYGHEVKRLNMRVRNVCYKGANSHEREVNQAGQSPGRPIQQDQTTKD